MLRSDIEKMQLSGVLEQDTAMMREIFRGDDILNVRPCASGDGKWKLMLFFFDGMVNNSYVDEYLLRPLQIFRPGELEPALEYAQKRIFAADMVVVQSDLATAVDMMLHGDTLIFIDGCKGVLSASTKGYNLRSVQEPDGEKVVRGPKEGFTENLTGNTAMLRRKLLSPDLKLQVQMISKRSRQRLCIAYLDTLVNRHVLDRLLQRLKGVDLDILLDTRYLEEIIRDGRWSPLKTMGSTEKPDIAAAKLLEGKIVIMVDGSPTASTLPFLFLEYFQAGDDYYTGFWNGSIARLLRILGFFITLTLPALYQALVTFHQEIIPSKLLLSIAASRSGVPFPTFVELALMLLAFEILREAGSMMPGSVGQALSTVGALVVGQAAVEARIVSAPLVIVVAVTGLTGMMTPKLVTPVLLGRLFLMVLAGLLGFPGIGIGLTAILVMLLDKESFGIPYMSYLGTLSPSDLRDTLIRAPMFSLRYRPKKEMTRDYVRMDDHQT
ncbi:MAG: spore germination protein [Ruminococcaceae bacterium]|nr:spore germination protein [Oscillospiraceae bacterium]